MGNKLHLTGQELVNAFNNKRTEVERSALGAGISNQYVMLLTLANKPALERTGGHDNMRNKDTVGTQHGHNQKASEHGANQGNRYLKHFETMKLENPAAWRQVDNKLRELRETQKMLTKEKDENKKFSQMNQKSTTKYHRKQYEAGLLRQIVTSTSTTHDERNAEEMQDELNKRNAEKVKDELNKIQVEIDTKNKEIDAVGNKTTNHRNRHPNLEENIQKKKDIVKSFESQTKKSNNSATKKEKEKAARQQHKDVAENNKLKGEIKRLENQQIYKDLVELENHLKQLNTELHELQSQEVKLKCQLSLIEQEDMEANIQNTTSTTPTMNTLSDSFGKGSESHTTTTTSSDDSGKDSESVSQTHRSPNTSSSQKEVVTKAKEIGSGIQHTIVSTQKSVLNPKSDRTHLLKHNTTSSSINNTGRG